MRCLIDIPSKVIWRTPRGRGARGSQGYMIRDVLMAWLETTVYRVALPKIQNPDKPFVWVDAWIPEDRRLAIPILDDGWVADGVYRTRCVISDNPKTLAAFIASGEAELIIEAIE